jgi:hypothetical protein
MMARLSCWMSVIGFRVKGQMDDDAIVFIIICHKYEIGDRSGCLVFG